MSMDEVGSGTFGGDPVETKPLVRRRANAPKAVRIWELATINSNKLADTLTGMSARGLTIFAVVRNPDIAGSFDVVSYSETTL